MTDPLTPEAERNLRAALEQVSANLIASQAQIRQLTADNSLLRNEVVRLGDQQIDLEQNIQSLRMDNGTLVNRLANSEQRRAEAEKALREIQRVGEEAPVDTLGDEDLPELPDAYIQAMREALERFAEGYAEYGPGAADPEGLAGQWGDMKRKIMKLRPVFWSGQDRLTRETPRVVLQDIIGHALLALEMLDRGFEGGRS